LVDSGADVRFDGGMRKLRPNDLRDLDRARLETLSQDELLETCEGLRALAIEQADRLNRHSGNSSKPPSSNDPYRRDGKTRREGRRSEDGKGNGDDGPSGGSSPSPRTPPVRTADFGRDGAGSAG